MLHGKFHGQMSLVGYIESTGFSKNQARLSNLAHTHMFSILAMR